MWFKNLQIYRLPAPWAFAPEKLDEALRPHDRIEAYAILKAREAAAPTTS